MTLAGRIFLAAALSAMASSAAYGQKGPCVEDKRKFCAEKRGWEEVSKCLEEHKAELSQACKEQVEKRATRQDAKRGPCEEDRSKFCADKRGWEEVSKCLQEHKTELAQACREFLEERALRRSKRQQGQERREEVLKACKGDIDKLCAEEARPLPCLRKNQAKLSEECKAAFAKR